VAIDIGWRSHGGGVGRAAKACVASLKVVMAAMVLVNAVSEKNSLLRQHRANSGSFQPVSTCRRQ